MARSRQPPSATAADLRRRAGGRRLRTPSWVKVLSDPRCICGAAKRQQRVRGGWAPVGFGDLRHPGFCDECTALLPDAVNCHLERATSQGWYMAWWRLAGTLLARAGRTYAIPPEADGPAADPLEARRLRNEERMYRRK